MMHATTFAETTDLTPQALEILVGNATLKAMDNGWTAEDVTYRLYARSSAVQKSSRSITIRFDFDRLGLDEKWTCWKVVTGAGKHQSEQWFALPEQAIEAGKQAGYQEKLIIRVPRGLKPIEALCERVKVELGAILLEQPPNRYREKSCDWQELHISYGQQHMIWPLSDDWKEQHWLDWKVNILCSLLTDAYYWRKPFEAWLVELGEAAEDSEVAQLRHLHAEITELVRALRILFGTDYREFALAVSYY